MKRNHSSHHHQNHHNNHHNPPRKWLIIPTLTISLLLFFFFIILLPYSKPSSSSLSSDNPSFTAHLNLPKLPKFAYLLTGTKGEVSQLKRVLQAIYHPRNYYLLHLDLEASSEERVELAKYVKSEKVFGVFGNVMVVGKGDLVTYKGPTMIASTLHSVALFLKRVGDWDWFVNLSASDYPLFSQDDLLHIFSFMPRDINFIEHTSNMGWKEFQRARPIIIDPGLYHSRVSSVYYAKERRSLPSSFKLFTGSEWAVLTKPFLEFCVYGWDNLPRTLLMYYTNFLSSNEGYFQTVLCNHKDYQNTTVNNDLRYLRWDNPPKQQPLSLKLEHFEDMAHSGAPFARRFDKDDPILDKIDRELLGRSDGRFTPGGWCLGNHLKGKDPCDVYGNPDVVNPSVRSKILEKLMLILLDSENFRPKQCK
ncbi:putative glucuronosyltransferase [Medicago truncatula]|uniref:Core-2/I-branching enzyme n=1 Tax=Medicago truncatula TaxID=3880 RepID=G7JUI4_MEDTR|nr:beta-glucuronosyltransferase GlcAT14C [Medicago truncatula]AES87158.1 core-2/I-branching enzyme [Medicago truncatula]RHN59150.1 putative glucuronosyltransferase [Medicago truncatula]